MGCAPSATTASPTGHRVSLADDKNAAEVMATDGIRTAAASADMRRQDPGATDRSATRVNGDVPLSKASLPEFIREQTNTCTRKETPPPGDNHLPKIPPEIAPPRLVVLTLTDPRRGVLTII